MPGSEIEAVGLTRRYGDAAVVQGLDLSIEPGCIFGFLGPNGAGKTTTVSMLTGMLAPSEGTVRVAGLDPLRDRRTLTRVVGLMPQSAALYDHLTCGENLEFQADLFGAPRARVHELIELCGLAQQVRKPAKALSGGWRQRLALACAVVHAPRVLFLDEPTAGVDPLSRRIFWDLLQGLNQSGTTIFVTTHYMEEVERCHRVGLIAGGVLKLEGEPRRLRQQVAETHELLAITADQPEELLALLSNATGVLDAYVYGDRVHASFPRDTAAAERLASKGFAVAAREATMEDVFVAAGRR
jgi:ABC-2 type transport system ATP-binding protein